MIEIPGDIVKLLMEVGYIAGGRGLFEESRAIFEAVRVSREESEYPLIGRAVTELNAGEYNEALKFLERAEELNPQNSLIKSFKGLTYKLMGETNRAREILEDLLKIGGEEEALNMARALLEEICQFS